MISNVIVYVFIPLITEKISGQYINTCYFAICSHYLYVIVLFLSFFLSITISPLSHEMLGNFFYPDACVSHGNNVTRCPC